MGGDMRGKPFFARRVEVGQGDPRIWPPGESVVLASDYAALRAEVEALQATVAQRDTLCRTLAYHLSSGMHRTWPHQSAECRREALQALQDEGVIARANIAANAAQAVPA